MPARIFLSTEDLSNTAIMTLCASCRRFDLLSFGQDPFSSRGYNLKKLIRTAGEGCVFCSFLHDSLNDEITKAQERFKSDCWLHLIMSKNYQAIFSNSSAPVSQVHQRKSALQFNKLFVIFGPRHFRLAADAVLNCLHSRREFCVLADSESAAAREGNVSGRYLGQDPTSDSHFLKIKTWLEECLKHHPRCRESASGSPLQDPAHSPLPTRCIGIGDEELKLIEMKNGETGKYVALSHRWNEETEFSKTIRQNHDARKRGFTIEGLPDIFKDAVSICKRLNIPYLWIDSICIIQGDQQDWQREAPRMRDYYQGAFFTISADGASSGEKGCLSSRQSIITGRLARLPYRNKENTEDGHFYVFRRCKHLAAEYISSVHNCPLQKRAWVLQERILSRRLIHYSKTKLYFECVTDLPQNECGEEIALDIFSEPQAREVALKKHFYYDEVSIEELWYSVVEIYSSLGISQPETDRLIAALGVAQEFQEMLERAGTLAQEFSGVVSRLGGELQYTAAGLWRRDLCHGLLWHQKEPHEIVTLSNCGAPTWSWAAYMMPIQWAHRQKGTREACHITEVQKRDYFILENAGKAIFKSPDYTERQQMCVHELEELWKRTEVSNSTGILTVTRKTTQVLTIVGRLRKVQVGNKIPTEGALPEMLQITGQPPARAATLWRFIRNTDTSSYDIGWGSLERLAVEENPCIRPYRDGEATYAFCVSTLEGVSGGIVYGNLSWNHKVYNVLFLQHKEGQRYERVGVGRLFEKNYFTNIVEQEFELA